MSQALADGIIAKLRADAALIDEMCSIYPGDITGEIGADAYILDEIASVIDELDWDTMRAHYLANRPKIIVTYGDYDEDSIDERSPSGVLPDRDHEY